MKTFRVIVRENQGSSLRQCLEVHDPAAFVAWLRQQDPDRSYHFEFQDIIPETRWTKLGEPPKSVASHGFQKGEKVQAVGRDGYGIIRSFIEHKNAAIVDWYSDLAGEPWDALSGAIAINELMHEDERIDAYLARIKGISVQAGDIRAGDAVGHAFRRGSGKVQSVDSDKATVLWNHEGRIVEEVSPTKDLVLMSERRTLFANGKPQVDG